MEARRLGADESDLALETLRLLKAPDGYPTPAPEYLVRFLSRPDNVLIVGTIDGVPVGFLLAYLLDRADRDQQMMFLYEIVVAESHRRRGIGTRMIAELKAICWAQNVMKMWVPTGRSMSRRPGSTPARAQLRCRMATKSHTRTLARASSRPSRSS